MQKRVGNGRFLPVFYFCLMAKNLDRVENLFYNARHLAQKLAGFSHLLNNIRATKTINYQTLRIGGSSYEGSDRRAVIILA
jgi:hypothetical protein